MDICRNVSVPGGLPAKCSPEMPHFPPSLKSEEFFPGENTEGEDDKSLEWLSIFVEDCLSSRTTYYNYPTPPPTTPKSKPPPALQNIEVPAKPRTKRRRTTHAHDQQALLLTPSDPPLLHQAYWLADSELVFPKKAQEDDDEEDDGELLPLPKKEQGGEEDENEEKTGKEGSLAQPRRCSHCLSQRTPQWRAGPLGPKTLCNACGVRFKSGRLLPEYRPAKSPTFVSYKHSNSHKKVLEMRMADSSSNPN